MAQSISFIYQIIDKFSGPLRKIEEANKKFRDNFEAGSKKVENVSKNMTALGARMAAASAAMAAGLAFSAKKAMDFEDVMTDVKKVVTFTSDEQFEKFRESVFKTSVQLGKLPKDIASIAVEGGKLGILPKDMGEFIGVVSRTSVAFDMLESTAAAQIGSIQAKLKLSVAETGNFMDAVNKLADSTSASGPRMLDIIKRTSGELGNIKMPTKYMAGWAAFADQIETGQELAASGLNMMIRKMSGFPGMMEKMLKDPNAAIRNMFKQLSKMDTVERTLFIQKKFGADAARFVLKAVNNLELLDKTLGVVKDETNFANSMMDELENKLGTATTAWAQMGAVMDVVAITIGDVLLPYIKELAPIVVKAALSSRSFVKAHPHLVKFTATLSLVGLALGSILLAAGALLPVIAGITAAFSASAGLMFVATLGVVAVAIGAVGAAIYQVWKNWDYLWMDFKIFVNWVKTTFLKTLDDIVKGFRFITDNAKKLKFWDKSEEMKLKTNIGGATSSFWDQLKKDFGFGETGVAAQNAITTSSTLNGNITVAAEKGSEVKSANLSTRIPGNLGMNYAGAIP